MNMVCISNEDFTKLTSEMDDQRRKCANLEKECAKLKHQVHKLRSRLSEEIEWTVYFVDEITKLRSEVQKEQFKNKMTFDKDGFVLYKELPDKTLFNYSFNNDTDLTIPCVARYCDGDRFIIRYDTNGKCYIPPNTKIK